jgi:hypothetical protein
MRTVSHLPNCGIPATGNGEDAAHRLQLLEWSGSFGYQKKFPGRDASKGREVR